MRVNLNRTNRSLTTMNRDNHDKSGRYVFETKIYNDDVIEKNKRLRLESMIPVGRETPVIDGGIRFSFSMTPEEWGFFKRDYPDIVEGLRSRDDSIRNSSALRIKILHPEWSITPSNR